MTQAIRLLSSQPYPKFSSVASPVSNKSGYIESTPTIWDDPFSSGALTYSTNGIDSFPAPSAYQSNKHAWVHIFPEGRIHQHPKKSLRYFKWGVSRLILESEPLPEIVPMFIDGQQDVMHESREFPRFVPRIGKNIRIAFGEKLDGEKVFGELRAKWKNLVQLQREALIRKGVALELEMGELTEGLKHSKEAQAIREEVTFRIRQEVLKVRRSLGLPDEDHKQGLVETWIEEGPKRTGEMDDGSFVGET
jgi:monolysocardiolipin acyltransferase